MNSIERSDCICSSNWPWSHRQEFPRRRSLGSYDGKYRPPLRIPRNLGGTARRSLTKSLACDLRAIRWAPFSQEKAVSTTLRPKSGAILGARRLLVIFICDGLLLVLLIADATTGREFHRGSISNSVATPTPANVPGLGGLPN